MSVGVTRIRSSAEATLPCVVWLANTQSINQVRARCAVAEPNTLYERLGLVSAHQSVGWFVLYEGTWAELRKMHESVRVCWV